VAGILVTWTQYRQKRGAERVRVTATLVEFVGEGPWLWLFDAALPCPKASELPW